MDIDFRSVVEHAESLAAVDPLQSERFAGMIRKYAPTIAAALAVPARIKPGPLPEAITAMTCSIFDNWRASGGKKPKRGHKGARAVRYKADFQAWTVEADRISFARPQWRATAHLLDAGDLSSKAEEIASAKRLRPISADYHSAILSYAEQLGAYLAGPLYSVTDGTDFHDFHMAFVDPAQLVDASGLKVALRLADRDIILKSFVDQDAGKNPLKGNCIAQARLANSTLLSNWKTGNIE